MRPTLPSANSRETRSLIGLVLIAACHHEVPPVAPGPPIPAEPEVAVASMTEECAGVVKALEAWKSCPNADDDEKEYIDAWIERAHTDFAAAEKAKPDAKAEHNIAHTCRKAADSVHAAIERCHAGKRPRDR